MRTSVDASNNAVQLWVVPPGETKCVLMTAGLVAYKLCNRGFDCENCPLYRALHEGCITEQCPEDVRERSLYLHVDLKEEIAEASQGDSRLATLLKMYERMTLHRRLFYAPGHTWIEIRTLNKARIGADDFLAAALPQIDAIILPEKGDLAKQGQPLLGFVVQGEWVPLLSPLTARIIKLNGSVVKDPGLVQRDPYGDGWLVEIQSEGLAARLSQLAYGEDFAALFRRDAQALFTEIQKGLTGAAAPVGVVSQDGGQPAASPVDALGTKRYVRILKAVLGRSAREV